MEIDVNSLISSVIAGGAIWAAIKVEIKFLWRDVGQMRQELEALRKANSRCYEK